MNEMSDEDKFLQMRETWRKNFVEQARLKKEAAGRYEPKGLKNIVKAFMKSSGLNFMKKNRSVLDVWHDIVGEDISSVTKPATFKGGILTIEVENPGLLQELEQFYKEEFLIKLREAVPETIIRNIKFKPGV